MSDRAPDRPPTLTLVTLAIALLSLSTAVYQGWLQTRNLEVVQRDLARRELIRSCKDVIEAYFEAKLRIGRVAALGAEGGSAPASAARDAAAVAVGRIGALGTYLANFQGEAARGRYTALTRALEAAAGAAETGAVARDRLFEAADGLFYGMNEDCVRSVRQEPA